MRPLPFLVVALLCARLAAAAPATLEVDLTDAPRGVFHAVETLPVSAGPLTLALPRWIPGEHGPTGPIGDLAGLAFSVDGRTLAWRRDPVDLFAFRVDVPAGATSLTARFDYLAAGSNGEYVDGPCATPNLAILSWNHVVLAPLGARQDEFTVTPSVRLPAGWRHGTALVEASRAQTVVAFAPVTLERLVDSPLTCGLHTRTVPLATELSPAHRVFLVGDSERSLAAPASLLAQWSDVVRESRALFGAPHYGSYTFLVTLSDAISHFGLEHHESSDNRMAERALIEGGGRTANALLLSHEFAHSWNGKHRRPADMVPPDFQAPLKTDLLWVYEGLTEYAGWVVGARARTLDAAATRDELARNAAVLEARAGRRWRPLVDTAIAASLLNTAPGAFSSIRRGQDYYSEGSLIWLEADVLIRRRTRGRRSLDDFTRAFFGGSVPSPPSVVPYTRADLVAALGAVAPYDWEGFFAARVDSLREHAPLGGLEAAGWELAWRDSSSDYLDALDAESELSDYRFSLGFRVGDSGTLSDVLPDSPAARAGLAPGAKLIAVEGRTYSRQALDDALDATRPAVADSAAAGPRGRDGIVVIAASDGFVRTYRMTYSGGPRKPVLRRRAGTPDLLAKIAAPRALRRK